MTDPAPRRSGDCLVVTSPGAWFGTRLELDGDDLIVGRQPEVDVRLDESDISRVHARLLVKPDHLEVSDLGSSNGTFVNGVAVTTSAVAYPGDIIAFATIVTRFERASPVGEVVQSEPRTTSVPVLSPTPSSGDPATDQGRPSADDRSGGLPRWLTYVGAVVGTLAAAVTALVALYPLVHHSGDSAVAAYQQQVLAACSRIHSANVQFGTPTGFASNLEPEYDRSVVVSALGDARQYIISQYAALNAHRPPASLRAAQARAASLQHQVIELSDSEVQALSAHLPRGSVTQTEIEQVAAPYQGQSIKLLADLDDAMTTLAGRPCKVSPG